MINGRWFSAPGEVVAPTNFLRQTGLHVGDTFDATVNGQTLHLTLVGEIFDQAREARDDVLIRGTFADPGDGRSRPPAEPMGSLP